MAKKINKEFWKSKTFWVNALLIVGGAITAVSEGLATGAPVTLIGIINLILRHFTEHPIEWKL